MLPHIKALSDPNQNVGAVTNGHQLAIRSLDNRKAWRILKEHATYSLMIRHSYVHEYIQNYIDNGHP